MDDYAIRSPLVIYTSGSTGRPKGVVLANRALSHLCAWTCECFRLTPTRAVATHPSLSFDASVIDIFPALSAGATLHLFDEEMRKDLAALRAYIEREGIWGGTMSTQIGMALLDAYPDLPLNYLMVGGEKLLPTAKTRVRILNGYGPTEFAVYSSCEEVDQSLSGDIPIGRPVSGTASVILDRLGQPVPAGFIGELALAGPQISEEYWHLPEKTAAVFITPTWAQNEGVFARYYRTGDLARSVAGTQHLVLYYSRVHTEEPSEAFFETLRAKMSETLTGYMVPDYFVRLDPMPLTPNGKINRRLLPTPSNASVGEFVEPANDEERLIAETYATILKHMGTSSATKRRGLSRPSSEKNPRRRLRSWMRRRRPRRPISALTITRISTRCSRRRRRNFLRAFAVIRSAMCF